MDEENRNRTESSMLGSLVSNLTDEIRTLIRGEVRLAQAEMSEKTSQAAKGAGSIAAAGAVLFSGFLVLLAAAVYGLHAIIDYGSTPWLSALIVGGVVLIIGAILVQSGRKKLQTLDLTPQRTMDSLRNDKDVAKHHSEHVKEGSQ
ncbi:phage holin family protein [Halomonas sp. McH1-25]|uniref:phage holin family protein n=1 Tax=unclassified Halomonas TaxID=2609666 RepID=UPI001EF68113|nr:MULTISPECIES: phage holin family protein [unclassified Halomonas]MCG7599343.1 phage holin family protein [Halomonas sp. McH1-25]MCP1343831.1 phage holin family protein [Halomonas sp. FL8]MCP1361124.1 phage holin family protein [Halomonas sp. BBD45]MCP1363831.1 phage holin family protein [Halomonas sp. BBD48]